MLRDAYGYCHATGCVYTGLYMLPALKDFLSLTVFMLILKIFICPRLCYQGNLMKYSNRNHWKYIDSEHESQYF